MNVLFTVAGLCDNLFSFAGELVNSVVEIEDSPVPETAAAHCNVHWSILCIIAIYGIYAAFRAAYIRRILLNEEHMPESPVAVRKKSRSIFHLDSLICVITLTVLCLSKFYWTCSVDYKVAVSGALIVIISTVIMEILNGRLYSRELG